MCRILGCQAASVDIETVPGGNILPRMSYSAIMAARRLPERSKGGFKSLNPINENAVFKGLSHVVAQC